MLPSPTALYFYAIKTQLPKYFIPSWNIQKYSVAIKINSTEIMQLPLASLEKSPDLDLIKRSHEEDGGVT